MDGLLIHSLAWEHVAGVVGTKDAVQCRAFFSNLLFPAWEQQVRGIAVHTTHASLQTRKQDEDE